MGRTISRFGQVRDTDHKYNNIHVEDKSHQHGFTSFTNSEEKKREPPKDGGLLDVPAPPNLASSTALAVSTQSRALHPVCGPGTAFNRNPLHKAVCEMDLAVIQNELASRPSEFFQRADSTGYCPIHSACSLCLKDIQNSRIATEIVRMMVTAGADVSVADSNGNTPLHWVARAGDKATAEFLLLKASPKGRKRRSGVAGKIDVRCDSMVSTHFIGLLLIRCQER